MDWLPRHLFLFKKIPVDEKSLFCLFCFLEVKIALIYHGTMISTTASNVKCALFSEFQWFQMLFRH